MTEEIIFNFDDTRYYKFSTEISKYIKYEPKTEEKVGFDAVITFHKSIDFYKLISKFDKKYNNFIEIECSSNNNEKSKLIIYNEVKKLIIYENETYSLCKCNPNDDLNFKCKVNIKELLSFKIIQPDEPFLMFIKQGKPILINI